MLTNTIKKCCKCDDVGHFIKVCLDKKDVTNAVSFADNHKIKIGKIKLRRIDKNALFYTGASESFFGWWMKILGKP